MRKSLLTVLLSVLLSAMLSGIAQAQTDGGYTPVPKSENTYPAYITDIYSNNGKTYIIADYIQWYEGKDADRVFAQREPDSGLEGAVDGYYIVNDNPKLRTLELQGDAKVLMQIYNRTGSLQDADIVWNEPVTLSTFKKIFGSDDAIKQYPYHLTVKDGKIVQITQQYIP